MGGGHPLLLLLRLWRDLSLLCLFLSHEVKFPVLAHSVQQAKGMSRKPVSIHPCAWRPPLPWRVSASWGPRQPPKPWVAHFDQLRSKISQHVPSQHTIGGPLSQTRASWKPPTAVENGPSSPARASSLSSAVRILPRAPLRFYAWPISPHLVDRREFSVVASLGGGTRASSGRDAERTVSCNSESTSAHARLSTGSQEASREWPPNAIHRVPRRFAVVDGSCIMFRCYHAMPPLKNREGDNVGAVMGFFRSLVQIRRLLYPSHIAVVFDHPTGRSSRLAISASYKRHRTQPPLELTEQIQKAKYLCAAMGLYPLEVEGVEGDDVIATLVDRLCTKRQQQQQQQQQQGGEDEFDEVVVATVDKDLLQLLRYNGDRAGDRPFVRVLALHRQFRLVDQHFVRDEYGVEPHQLLDFFALVGDRADGIVGCRGIGAAAAKKVLKAFEGLEALQEAPEGLKALSLRSSQLSALSDFLPQWETNRRLVALDCEVAAARAASLASFRLRPVGIDNLRRKFAPYNLSKQADLWVQAEGPCASTGAAAASLPPKVADTQKLSLATAEAAATARTSTAAASEATGAKLQSVLANRSTEGRAAKEVAVKGLSEAADYPAAASTAAAGFAQTVSVTAGPVLSSIPGMSSSIICEFNSSSAEEDVFSYSQDEACDEGRLPFSQRAKETPSSWRSHTSGSAGLHERVRSRSTVLAAAAAEATPAQRQQRLSTVSSNGEATWGLWGRLASLWLSGTGGPSILVAQGAPVARWSGPLSSVVSRQRQLSLLLVPFRFSQRRLLVSEASPTPGTAKSAAAALEASVAKTAAAVAHAPLETPSSCCFAGSSNKTSRSGASGNDSSSIVRSVDSFEFELQHQMERRHFPVEGSTNGGYSGNSSSDRPNTSPAATNTDIATAEAWGDNLRRLILQEKHHVKLLQRHLQQMRHAAAEVEAAAAAAAAAAAPTLKATRVRAARAAMRHSSAAATGPATSAAASGEATSGEKVRDNLDYMEASAPSAKAADPRPLLPAIECMGSSVSAPPLRQAEAFRSTLIVCLRYLFLLVCSRNSSAAVAAAATAEGLCYQLPEPLPLNPLQMSLAVMNSEDSSESRKINDRNSCNTTTVSSNSKSSVRHDRSNSSSSDTNSSCPSGRRLLLPVSVAWLAANPSGPHAPASALWPLHLTFSICLPAGLKEVLTGGQEAPQQCGQQDRKQQRPDLVHFHFQVSKLLQDPRALHLLRCCLRAQGLEDLSRLDASPRSAAQETPREALAETASAPAAAEKDSCKHPAIVWAVHDAKQLLHLLLNAGLSPPPAPHLHCTSVVAWLLHGANPKVADLLQHSTLYELLHQHRQQWRRLGLQEALEALPASSAPTAVAAKTEGRSLNFVRSDLAAGMLSSNGLPHAAMMSCGRDTPVQESLSGLQRVLRSPYTDLIVEEMTAAAAAIENAQRRKRADPQACAAAAAGPPATASPALDLRANCSSDVQIPWRFSALARHSLLPPEQHQLQQGLFGRFGWGIYSKSSLKTKNRRGEKSQGKSDNSSNGSTAVLTPQLRLCFQPVAAAASEPIATASQGRDSTCERPSVGQEHHGARDAKGSISNSSGGHVRFPPQFRRCSPPRSPDLLDLLDVETFCEARSAATLMLFEQQQQLLLQQQHAAEERQQPQDTASCLSLAWGVWAQVERPLLPALVAVERRGLSLSTSILTDGWRAKRSSGSLALEGTKKDPLSLFPAASVVSDVQHQGNSVASNAATVEVTSSNRDKLMETELGTADCSEALQQQRHLESRIWRQIGILTGGVEVNINSPSQLAELLFDRLQLSLPPAAFSEPCNSSDKVQASSRNGSNSTSSGRSKGSSGSRSTGAEALQALLRVAQSGERDARKSQVAALLSALLEYRASHKFISTYFASLPSYIFPLTKRIHVSLLQTGASTGRLACRNPNLQNIPNHQEEWRWIRRAFIPSPVSPLRASGGAACGDALSDALTGLRLNAIERNKRGQPETTLVKPAAAPREASPEATCPVSVSSPWRFLSIDYSQMELHILAYLSNDPQLLHDLKGGAATDTEAKRYDSFQLTASRLFGCRPAEVTKERRSIAKTVTYGILYGQTEGGLSRQLQVPLKNARRLIDCFFSEYRGVQILTRTHTQFAEATGTIETLVGRSRRLEGTDEVYAHLGQHAQLAMLLQQIGASKKSMHEKPAASSSNKSRCRRQAMNTPIQGLAADIMKYVTARVEQLLDEQQQQAFEIEQRRQGPHSVSSSTAQVAVMQPSHAALKKPLRAQVVLQIHDELLLEVHEEDIQLTLNLVVPLMERAWGLLLVETGCLDRYAALCRVQRRLDGIRQLDNEEEERAVLHAWALQTAGSGCNADHPKWFSLPHNYEWLRPLLQRKLPTSAKVGCDWACC